MSLKSRLAKVEKELKLAQYENVHTGQCKDYLSNDEILESIKNKKLYNGYLTKKRIKEFVKSQDVKTLRQIVNICEQLKATS